MARYSGATCACGCGGSLRSENKSGWLRSCWSKSTQRTESISEYKRSWKDKNSDRLRAERAAKYQANRDEILAQQKKYRESNPGLASGRVKTWRENNPEKAQVTKANSRASRRAREREAFVEHVDRSAVWERDGGICHICKLPADRDAWHLEHVVALDNDGEHSYANTAVSHPSCNWSKGTK